VLYPSLNQVVAALSASVLPITVEDANAQATLPDSHRDPFDCLRIAQVLTGN
jgi:PIN domain nuclease of toxin-antitoxin system